MTVIFWADFFWGQIAFQFMFSEIMIIVLLWMRPLESNFETKIETFNEVANICTYYLL